MYTRIKEATDIDLYRQSFPTESDRLIAWFLINHYQLTKDEAFDCITDGANDNGIDAVFVEDDKQIVHIIQSKFTSGEKCERSDIDDLRKAYEALKDLPALQRDGNAKIKIAIDKFGDCIRSGYTVSLEFVSTSKVCKGVKSSLTHFAGSVGKNDCGFNAEVHLFDSPVLENIYTRCCTGGAAFAVDFTFSKKNAHAYTIRERNKVTYHMDIPMIELLGLPEVRSGRVFDINPRKYLGVNKINRGIEDTIRNRHWLFNDGNNGITAVCQSVVSNDSDNTFTIKGMQIVNGCQTVNSIFNCSEFIKDTPELASGQEGFVHIKVVAGASKPEVDFISETSNKQSGMRHRDFISQDELIIKTKKTYERKYPNGKFMAQRGTEHKDCPPDKVIDLVEYASCVAVWNCLKPTIVGSETRIFEEKRLLFKEGYQAEEIYNINKIATEISGYWAEIKNSTTVRSPQKKSLAERRSITKYKHMYSLVLLISTLYWGGNHEPTEHILKPSAFYNKLSDEVRHKLIKDSSDALAAALRNDSDDKDNLVNSERWVKSQSCNSGVVKEIDAYLDRECENKSFIDLVNEIKQSLSDSDFYERWKSEE